jgi:uncharacterized protein (DUF1330 family)
MAAYIVFIRDRLRDEAEFREYSKAAGPTLQGRTAKVHAAYGANEALEGAPSDGVVLVEFPTMEEARDWYNSPGYTEARKHRFLAADYRAVLFESL